MCRLDCEFDNENLQNSGATGGNSAASSVLPMLATSPSSAVGAGDTPTSQRMERFELRYLYP